LGLVFVLCSVWSRADNRQPEDTVRRHLQQMIGETAAAGAVADAFLDVEGLRIPLHRHLPDFYRRRDFNPAWTDAQGRVSVVAWQWLDRIQGVAAEGLDPRDYHVGVLAASLEAAHVSRAYEVDCEPAGLALIDLLLTDSFLKYVSQLFPSGDDAAGAGMEGAKVAVADVVSVLNQVLRRQQVGAVLDALASERAGYRRLLVYLEHYRRLDLAGGWPVLDDGPPVALGQRDSRLPALRRVLALVGDLDAAALSSGQVMDRVTAEALKRFQARHGLRPDGVLGQQTLAQINVPVVRRIEQITVNLERERWPDRDVGARYLQVDITDFHLSVFDSGIEVMRMPVVVGTSFRRTPVFSALMTYLVFAPYWTVPPTILQQDKLPLIKANPNYLKAHHYEIVAWGKDPDRTIDPRGINWKQVTAETFPGLLRQKPGPWNPLGRVKFMFPNAYHVYLHDTPSRHLFEEQQRTFSSGCIRIARPLDLAVFLLEGQQGWSKERVAREMARSRPYTVYLERPLPVHILYRTAWVDTRGRLQFRNDIYEKDSELLGALRQRSVPSENDGNAPGPKNDALNSEQDGVRPMVR